MVPQGFCRRFQTAGLVMAKALEARLASRLWPRGFSRQRGGHWLRKFLNLCRMDYPDEEPLAVLRGLVADGVHFLG